MYLTYDEYIQMGGNTADEATFENLEFEARTQIDYWTFNRLVNETVQCEAVKRCMIKLIALLADQQQLLDSSIRSKDGTSNAGILSQSNDGVSISYASLSARDTQKALQESITSTIQQYLGNVKNSLGQKVLYRGIYSNE